MCGICGYTRYQQAISDRIIDDMKDALVHRGPDDHGTYADDQIVLGHRRLSIIDLSGGHQPLSNEDGTIVVSANGEIYNFLDLKRSLERDGHQFRTHSDTEVLVHLYEDFGNRMMDRLIGMFSFALWDGKQKKLLLARDRYGQKPLYYAERDGQIIFSSELKSLVRHPCVEKNLDKVALSRYLAFEYVPAPFAIYQGVQKLDAGSCLQWHRGRLQIERFWDYPLGQNRFPGTAEECCKEMLRLLGNAVRRQLLSDVPLGVFLSGGIDSSSIVALAAQEIPSHKIKTFCIGFREETFDEVPYARFVAQYFGTDHVEDILDVKKMVDILPEVVGAFDEPFADASAIPTYLLARFAKQHITVALGGDGGDELFAGYDPFVAHRLARFALFLPDWFNRGILLKLVEKLPPSDINMGIEFRAKRFLRYLHQDPVVRNHLWLGSFNGDMQKELLTDEFGRHVGDPFEDIKSAGERFGFVNDVDVLIYDYISTYLQEDILTKVDRASMAHALEVRAPFLDHEFGEFVASIPPKWKLRGLTTKYILKRAMTSLLPQRILHRKKKGFGIPKAKWLREDLRDCLEDLFNRKSVNSLGIFSYNHIRKIMDEHFHRIKDHQKELWTLMMFELWRRENAVV